ncbi:hypothetical protein HMI54_015009 [Coelomomyces lativittatus]|nr:hypothetical protein HMI54_015009 [Coelomomyces lativittatus]KAJ1518066.1 hypothetical protein HMI55_003419 [Coelomomyces lativittatus]
MVDFFMCSSHFSTTYVLGDVFFFFELIEKKEVHWTIFALQFQSLFHFIFLGLYFLLFMYLSILLVDNLHKDREEVSSFKSFFNFFNFFFLFSFKLEVADKPTLF